MVVHGPPPSDRSLAAWRVWLHALASDADAALSAAMTYEALARDARIAWLDALDTDLEAVDVPLVAAYAPLLAVETDDELRARIERRLEAAGNDALGDLPLGGRRAYAGPADVAAEAAGSALLVVVAAPLYLHFVELLVCRVVPNESVTNAGYEPLWDGRTLGPRFEIDGLVLDEMPVRDAVDLLAHAVLGDRRARRAPPEELGRFPDLFALRAC